MLVLLVASIHTTRPDKTSHFEIKVPGRSQHENNVAKEWDYLNTTLNIFLLKHFWRGKIMRHGPPVAGKPILKL